jgi:hypothetical protein
MARYKDMRFYDGSGVVSVKYSSGAGIVLGRKEARKQQKTKATPAVKVC